MMKTRSMMIVLLPIFLLTGCASHYTDDAVRDPYGFFSGFWHGAIFIFALMANVISWFCGLVGISFMDSIEIIGRPNTGFWYYFGFALGLAAAAGNSAR